MQKIHLSWCPRSSQQRCEQRRRHAALLIPSFSIPPFKSTSSHCSSCTPLMSPYPLFVWNILCVVTFAAMMVCLSLSETFTWIKKKDRNYLIICWVEEKEGNGFSGRGILWKLYNRAVNAPASNTPQLPASNTPQLPAGTFTGNLIISAWLCHIFALQWLYYQKVNKEEVANCKKLSHSVFNVCVICFFFPCWFICIFKRLFYSIPWGEAERPTDVDHCYYCRVFTLQYKVPWGPCCCGFVIYKLNWLKLFGFNVSVSRCILVYLIVPLKCWSVALQCQFWFSTPHLSHTLL